MSEFSLSDINNRILENSDFVDDLKKTLNKIIIGQEDLINKIIIGMLSDGHILLEGVPGLAKTLTVKTFSKLINVNFQRIQFTPDMLPADLLGMIYNQRTAEFETRKGLFFQTLF